MAFTAAYSRACAGKICSMTIRAFRKIPMQTCNKLLMSRRWFRGCVRMRILMALITTDAAFAAQKIRSVALRARLPFQGNCRLTVKTFRMGISPPHRMHVIIYGIPVFTARQKHSDRQKNRYHGKRISTQRIHDLLSMAGGARRLCGWLIMTGNAALQIKFCLFPVRAAGRRHPTGLKVIRRQDVHCVMALIAELLRRMARNAIHGIDMCIMTMTRRIIARMRA